MSRDPSDEKRPIAEITVAQDENGETLTLLEEYYQRNEGSNRWFLFLSASCAIISLIFTYLTFQKL